MHNSRQFCDAHVKVSHVFHFLPEHLSKCRIWEGAPGVHADLSVRGLHFVCLNFGGLPDKCLCMVLLPVEGSRESASRCLT